MLEKQVSAIRFDTFLDKIWTLELGGCLGGTLGPPWGTFGSRALKTSKQSLSWTSFSSSFCHIFLKLARIWWNLLCKHLSWYRFGPKGPFGPSFQELLGTILKTLWSKGEKVKTVFPCMWEHQNQALEAMLLVMLFVIFTHMLSGALFSMFFCRFHQFWINLISSSTPFWNAFRHFDHGM